MKRFLICSAVLLFMCGVSFAEYNQGGATLHRSAVGSNDGDFSTISSTSGFNPGIYETVMVEVSSSVAGATCVLTPGYYSDALSQFASGSSLTVGNGIYYATTYGYKNMYFRISSISSGNFTIYLRPVHLINRNYQP